MADVVWDLSGVHGDSPRREGFTPLRQRSPSVYIQQNLGCTPSLVPSAPHTIYLPKGVVRALGLRVWFGILLIEFTLLPALRSLWTESCQRNMLSTYNNLSSSLDKFAHTGSETLRKHWNQSGLLFKLFGCCTWMPRHSQRGKHLLWVFRLAAPSCSLLKLGAGVGDCSFGWESRRQGS